MTVADSLERASRRLNQAGIDSAAWDAERLLRHVMDWDRATLIARGREELPAEEATALWSLVEQRAARRPLQYLVGRQEFFRHEFFVGPEALIPRPETEILVEASLEALSELQDPVILDVGTGSGCVALSLAMERSDAEVHATDISPAALRLAARNAAQLGLEGRLQLHEGDLIDGAPNVPERLDMVVSNPPYVDARDLDTLAAEVREHEPHCALVAPEGALALYDRLLGQAAGRLPGGRWLLVEIGQGQRDAVTGLCESRGFDVERVVADLQAIPRVIVARRH